MLETHDEYEPRPRAGDFAVKLANSILDMEFELHQLRAEAVELRKYRDDYLALLQSGIRHNEEMMVGLLQVAMTPGVMEAMHEANKEEDHVRLQD